eukprot:scaffold363_cov331-Pavlova_lutheri.AAC.110
MSARAFVFQPYRFCSITSSHPRFSHPCSTPSVSPSVDPWIPVEGSGPFPSRPGSDPGGFRFRSGCSSGSKGRIDPHPNRGFANPPDDEAAPHHIGQPCIAQQPHSCSEGGERGEGKDAAGYRMERTTRKGRVDGTSDPEGREIRDGLEDPTCTHQG